MLNVLNENCSDRNNEENEVDNVANDDVKNMQKSDFCIKSRSDRNPIEKVRKQRHLYANNFMTSRTSTNLDQFRRRKSSDGSNDLNKIETYIEARTSPTQRSSTKAPDNSQVKGLNIDVTNDETAKVENTDLKFTNEITQVSLKAKNSECVHADDE